MHICRHQRLLVAKIHASWRLSRNDWCRGMLCWHIFRIMSFRRNQPFGKVAPWWAIKRNLFLIKLGNRCFVEWWLHALVTKRHFILIMVGASSHVFCLSQALLTFKVHIGAHFFKLFDWGGLNGLAGPWFRLDHVWLFHDSPRCLRPHNRLVVGVLEAWVLV